ncbi:hypothetical protein OOT46_27720 [Aquabacterium sp. A7-Y]|uniref:hypothetical protein n=1 Tax=Aquabacterium sp. A7-Y TaxID=1349605 RepID=UPI00223DDA8B|nr:hypothetical protein [Aquabacterium sp. A7-Y]MCW7541599.1 hypothetical protein [Aquabacterium sp. A7-Y]
MKSEVKTQRGVAAGGLLVALAALAATAIGLVGCAQQTVEKLPGGPPPVAGSKPPARYESPATSWDQYRVRAGQRIAQANQGSVYLDTPPDILLAIPVLEVELNADGSIRRIQVLRHPRQARDTTQLAIDAVRRAAPFGDVSRLPKPWRFPETFLFRDDRKFKPRSIDG